MTRVRMCPPRTSPAVPIPDVSESRPSSHCTMIRPPAPYHDVDWTCAMKFASQASPTVGTELVSAIVGPSCMTSTAFGVTQTKSGALGALRSLWTPLALLSGTTFWPKSASDVVAGEDKEGLWGWREDLPPEGSPPPVSPPV